MREEKREVYKRKFGDSILEMIARVARGPETSCFSCHYMQ
jgi:hypothetical protein